MRQQRRRVLDEVREGRGERRQLQQEDGVTVLRPRVAEILPAAKGGGRGGGGLVSRGAPRRVVRWRRTGRRRSATRAEKLGDVVADCRQQGCGLVFAHLPRPPAGEREAQARERERRVADARHARLQRDAPRDDGRVVEEVVGARDDARGVEREHPPRHALPPPLPTLLRVPPRQPHRHQPLDERGGVDRPRGDREGIRRLVGPQPGRKVAHTAEPRRVHRRVSPHSHRHRRQPRHAAESIRRAAVHVCFRRGGGGGGGRCRGGAAA
mmetsp:Transcript_38133/g.92673  ORF Transcript_38133/g.92673 Transcript_38133/m.92673 type:complete len:267 (+) Transcript_38133:2-802(+)